MDDGIIARSAFARRMALRDRPLQRRPEQPGDRRASDRTATALERALDQLPPETASRAFCVGEERVTVEEAMRAALHALHIQRARLAHLEPAHERIAWELAGLRNFASRARTILENMAQERTGWRRIFGRWPIAHEPLRADARNLLAWWEARR